MKKILLAIIIAATAISAYAQPRAAGLRVGVSGFEADYQHTFVNNDQFLEGTFGVDFGYNINGEPGVKAAATYNFIWAHPAWTNKGSWALYAGPGVAIGYVNDNTAWKGADGNIQISGEINGFMLGICGQVGLEYTFWFPLQLSVDLRPVVGLHVSESYRVNNPIEPSKPFIYKSQAGFYDNGLLGLVPSISVRYRF